MSMIINVAILSRRSRGTAVGTISKAAALHPFEVSRAPARRRWQVAGTIGAGSVRDSESPLHRISPGRNSILCFVPHLLCLILH
jgi:hypothetical protein